MAALTTGNPTLLDLAMAKDPDGKIAKVVEILNKTNPMLKDMTVIEGNLPTGNKSVIRTGIPDPSFRKIYGGTQPSKSTRIAVVDNCAELPDYAVVDKTLADLSGDLGAFLLSENNAHIEGMTQKMARTMFLGDETITPEEFTGLNFRYNLKSAVSGANIIDGGGTGSDNASIWIVGWSPETVCGIVPKGSEAGLVVTDQAQQTVKAEDGGDFEAYRTYYNWKLGLCVKDWRYAGRIANIDRSELTGDASSGANLCDLCDQILDLPPNLDGANFYLYMDKQILGVLRRQAKSKLTNSTYSVEISEKGSRIESYGGVLLRKTDALNVDEARIV